MDSIGMDVAVSVEAGIEARESISVTLVRSWLFQPVLKWVRPSQPAAGYWVQITPGPRHSPSSPRRNVGNVLSIRTSLLPETAKPLPGQRFSFAVSAYTADATVIGDPGMLLNQRLG